MNNHQGYVVSYLASLVFNYNSFKGIVHQDVELKNWKRKYPKISLQGLRVVIMVYFKGEKIYMYLFFI